MGSIVLLDDLTINQIAAGEVIERPANVVKELVENSIDAGATSISVDIENGGITSIRITDNGKGIAPDDIEIAFERHATSKIRSSDDLIKVMTMGFRGEALASIAAIAKVELITRTKDYEIGTKIIVEGGDIISKEECGAPLGTTIIVRELFYNTPVRYKFLKKDFTEGGYIEAAVEKIALINPNISFRLNNNRKTVLQTSGNGDIKSVVYNIFGKDISQSVMGTQVAAGYTAVLITPPIFSLISELFGVNAFPLALFIMFMVMISSTIFLLKELRKSNIDVKYQLQ
jgi:DNA mismatch repair protein MutL